MREQKSLVWSLDVYYYLDSLESHSLAAMNDPTGNTGRIEPCSSAANKSDALSKLDTAVMRALHGKDFDLAGRTRDAFAQWDLLFNGHFPACTWQAEISDSGRGRAEGAGVASADDNRAHQEAAALTLGRCRRPT